MSRSELAEMTFWEYIPPAAFRRRRSLALYLTPNRGSIRARAKEL